MEDYGSEAPWNLDKPEHKDIDRELVIKVEHSPFCPECIEKTINLLNPIPYILHVEKAKEVEP